MPPCTGRRRILVADGTMRMESRCRTAHTVRLVLLTGPLPPGASSASPATSCSRCARASVRRGPF